MGESNKTLTKWESIWWLYYQRQKKTASEAKDTQIIEKPGSQQQDEELKSPSHLKPETTGPTQICAVFVINGYQSCLAALTERWCMRIREKWDTHRGGGNLQFSKSSGEERHLRRWCDNPSCRGCHPECIRPPGTVPKGRGNEFSQKAPEGKCPGRKSLPWFLLPVGLIGHLFPKGRGWGACLYVPEQIHCFDSKTVACKELNTRCL